MNRKHQTSLTWTVLVAALAWSAGVAALPLLGKPRQEQNPTAGFVPPGREAQPESLPQGMSAKDAARQAQSLNGGGRVLSVDEANGGWRVKLLKDGNVRFVFVPN